MHWRIVYMKAIRSLDEKWVHQDTQITVWDETRAVVANQNFAPMIYDVATGKWEEIKYSAPPRPPKERDFLLGR